MQPHIIKEALNTIHVDNEETLRSIALALKTTAAWFDEAHDRLRGDTPAHDEERHILDEQARYYNNLYYELTEGFGL